MIIFPCFNFYLDLDPKQIIADSDRERSSGSGFTTLGFCININTHIIQYCTSKHHSLCGDFSMCIRPSILHVKMPKKMNSTRECSHTFRWSKYTANVSPKTKTKICMKLITFKIETITYVVFYLETIHK